MSKEVNVKFGGWGVVLSIVFFVASSSVSLVFIGMVVIFFILLKAIA